MPLLKVEDNFEATLVGNYTTSSSTITLSNVPVLRTSGYLTVFDFNGNQYEKIKFTGVSGLTITGCLRGLSFTDNSDVEISGNKKELKTGMTVKLTVSQNYINDAVDVLNGTSPSGGIMKNPTVRTINNARHLVDKEYADGIISTGISALAVTESATALKININSGYYSLNGAITYYAGAADQDVVDDATNYVELTDGVLAINQVGFDDDSMPLAVVICASGAITSLTDARAVLGWLDIKTSSGIGRDTNGIFIDLATDPGLEFTGGKLDVKLKSGGGLTKDSGGIGLLSNNIAALIAGETITGATTPVPVFIGDGVVHNTATLIEYTTSGFEQNTYGVNWTCQTFTLDSETNAITGISVYVLETGSPSGNATLSLHAVDGSNKPTGAALASKNLTANLAGTYDGWVRFDFASTVDVSPSTKYAIVVSVPSGDASNKWQLLGSTGGYSGGEAGTSSNSGSTWTMNTNDCRIRVYGGFKTTAGKIYKSDANVVDRSTVFGFAISSGNLDESIDVISSGKISGFTGLTAGSTYYVSDTAGTISDTIGTAGIKVGMAVSTTELLINLRKATSGYLSRGTTDATLVIHHLLNKVPSLFKLTCIYGGAPTLAVQSIGTYDGKTQQTIYYYDAGAGSPTLTGGASTSLIGNIDDESGSGDEGTNITASLLTPMSVTLTFTTAGGDTSQAMYMLWEAFE